MLSRLLVLRRIAPRACKSAIRSSGIAFGSAGAQKTKKVRSSFNKVCPVLFNEIPGESSRSAKRSVTCKLQKLTKKFPYHFIPICINILIFSAYKYNWRCTSILSYDADQPG